MSYITKELKYSHPAVRSIQINRFPSKWLKEVFEYECAVEYINGAKNNIIRDSEEQAINSMEELLKLVGTDLVTYPIKYKQWQYLVLYCKDDHLANYGTEGWELIAVKEDKYYFKRELK